MRDCARAQIANKALVTRVQAIIRHEPNYQVQPYPSSLITHMTGYKLPSFEWLNVAVLWLYQLMNKREMFTMIVGTHAEDEDDDASLLAYISCINKA